jgi:ribosome-binding protein aMBF1 (putative translation factor)
MQSSPIPLPVERALGRVGQSLALARRRRHLSQEALAERIGASVNTVRRMEDGHPGTALQHFARALQVFGELDG